MIAEIYKKNTIGIVRILFGVILAIDASFKWHHSFTSDFTSYLTSALPGQPTLVQAWIHFWIEVVKVDPAVFAYTVATVETVLAIFVILGILSNLTYLGGSLLFLVIWSTAEGFGGPYTSSSTDIGTAIIYVFVFALLFLSRAGLVFGLDRLLASKLGAWAFLASGSPPSSQERS